jgi:hypothetical protein
MKTFAVSVLALAALCVPASAAVVISSGATSRMNCSGGVCTPTAKNAVLNTGDLQAMLANGDVTVETANGAQAIAVTAPLTWASTSRLTLSSVHSVTFKAAVVAEGTAGLTLATDGKQPGGDVLFYPGGSVTFWDISSSLVIDGTSYTLVNGTAALIADAAADPSGAYALANDYDASVDGAYARSVVKVFFAGRFEGLGHAISNLTFDMLKLKIKPADVALFHAISPKGIVRDLALVNVAMKVEPHVSEAAAPVAGTNSGSIVNVSATGSIDASMSSSGDGYAGLVTTAGKGSLIRNSWSSVSIAAPNPFSTTAPAHLAGLVWLNNGSIDNSTASGTLNGLVLAGLVYNNAGSITNSHASGTLVFKSPEGQWDEAEGLVSVNEGPISGSYSTCNFTGDSVPGSMVGFVGTNYGAISNSWSNSAMTQDVGGVVVGFVGDNDTLGTIVNSYATGNLSAGSGGVGGTQVAGFVSINFGSIAQSFATGSVTDAGAVSETDVGGFAGFNRGTIANSYAFGAVTANRKAHAAGFVSYIADGTITGSYSTGLVSGGLNPNTEGFAALANGGTIADSYWDVDTSGQNKSKGGGTPIKDAALKASLPAGFDPAVWAQSPAINNGYPYLIANPPQ